MIKKYFFISLIIILFLGSSATAVYFYTQWKKATTVVNPQEEIEDVLAVVSNYMELPQGENPTIATVVDREKLQDQAFFVNAENGDKVLIYTNARKAILYRPSTKKVVEVAPIYFDETQNTPSPTSSSAGPSQ